DRFAVMVFLCLAVMVAFGVKTLVGWLAQRRPHMAVWHHVALFLSLLALLVVDYLAVPMATRQPTIPPFLSSLPPGAGALLEYPFHDDVPYRDAERMLFQTVHGRPISGGYHSRRYPQPQLGLPVLRDLRAGQLNSDIVEERGGWPGALNTIGYDYIIGYKQQPLGPLNLEPEELPAFRRMVEQGLGLAEPAYEDDWLVAYRVPDALSQPVIQIRQGWGDVEVGETTRHRWLGESAELGLFAPQAGVYRLSFRALPAGGPRRLLLSSPQQQLELPLQPGERRYTVLLALPAGRTLLSLRSAEPPTSGQALENNGDLRPISVRFASLELEEVGED
ncbi:MAG: hypothetical protein MUD01_26635, partial [Chloroflexaceae bacterium]|nr:hypothetical protein [Chloroflexaceae bacterium]